VNPSSVADTADWLRHFALRIDGSHYGVSLIPPGPYRKMPSMKEPPIDERLCFLTTIVFGSNTIAPSIQGRWVLSEQIIAPSSLQESPVESIKSKSITTQEKHCECSFFSPDYNYQCNGLKIDSTGGNDG
jgi:hypothetical protein